MHLEPCKCEYPGMAGLGQDYMSWLETASTLFSQDGGGDEQDQPAGSSSQAQATTTTTTQVQVSPQISPIFVQQSNPVSSPVNAGAAMAPVGTIPNTGYLPGFDAASGFLPTGVPGIPSQRIVPSGFPAGAAVAALALVGFALFMGKKRKRKGKR